MRHFTPTPPHHSIPSCWLPHHSHRPLRPPGAHGQLHPRRQLHHEGRVDPRHVGRRRAHGAAQGGGGARPPRGQEVQAGGAQVPRGEPRARHLVLRRDVPAGRRHLRRALRARLLRPRRAQGETHRQLAVPRLPRARPRGAPALPSPSSRPPPLRPLAALSPPFPHPRQVRELLTDFHESRYASCLSYLERPARPPRRPPPPRPRRAAVRRHPIEGDGAGDGRRRRRHHHRLHPTSTSPPPPPRCSTSRPSSPST